MISAIAIDDEPVALDIIRMHAAKVSFIKLKQTFTSARAALNYLAVEAVELIFLDINMPDIGGLEFATLVSPQTQLIFTTAHTDYAVTGFDLTITDFLLKPFNYNRFLKACIQAQNRGERRQEDPAQNSDSLFVKDGYNWVRIELKGLLFIKSEDNYTGFVEEHRRTFVRMTLQELLNKLSGKNFLRVHKSYVVNKDHIQKFEKNQLLINGIKIPVSRFFMDDLKRYLLK
ncbi:MAG: LytTR family DNA-binding domain-containing protein [Daejeonella sp.]|uniref:LytR/AlgR family response regulator transcription factor n=1 Tax=Daejeonella sp. TaxID=2805397 RepID=UPI003C70A67C